MSKTTIESEDLQRLYHISVEEAVVGTLWVDSKGHFYRANKAICRMLGYTQEELLKFKIPDIRPAAYREGIIEMLMEKSQNGKSSFEVSFRKKDGQLFPVELAANFIEGFEVESYHCTFIRDISERKRSEAALQQSHDRLCQALEGTLTAIARAVEARDLYVADHQRRVAQLACAIAE
jgi:PAS domain S-box-containing protein